MKTKVVGIRLTDYQIEKLVEPGKVIHSLVDDYCEGRYANLVGLKRKADKLGVSLQSLIDRAENEL